MRDSFNFHHWPAMNKHRCYPRHRRSANRFASLVAPQWEAAVHGGGQPIMPRQVRESRPSSVGIIPVPRQGSRLLAHARMRFSVATASWIPRSSEAVDSGLSQFPRLFRQV
jgi:hypothetical protein